MLVICITLAKAWDRVWTSMNWSETVRAEILRTPHRGVHAHHAVELLRLLVDGPVILMPQRQAQPHGRQHEAGELQLLDRPAQFLDRLGHVLIGHQRHPLSRGLTL